MGEPLRVLYVEDDPDFAALATAHLERRNPVFEVALATSGEAALEHLEDRRCDCIVADLELAGMDGIELLEVVRRDHDHLPFIIFTGRGGEEVASEAIRSQVTDYLRKGGDPERFDLLANRIEYAVERHRAQTNFRALFEQLHLGVTIHESDHGTIVAANEAFAQLVGIEAGELVGSHPGDFSVDAPEFTPERATEVVQRTVSFGPQTFEWQVYGGDGEPIWVEVHLTPTRIDHRDRVLAFVEDITDRKHRDEAIKNLHEVATELAGSSREEVYDLTVEAAERLFEFDRAALAVERNGRLEVMSMSEAMPVDERPTMDTDEGIAGLTYQTGSSYVIDNVATDPRAVPQMDAASAMSIPIGDHGIFQVIDDRPGTFDRDDLELAELLVRHTASALDLLDREQALEQKNDRLEEFVSFVSHDLRGPLSVARGRLELIEDEHPSGHTAGLGDALGQMEELIEALLALARDDGPTAGTEWTDIGHIARRCWSNIDSADASLEIAEPLAVMADPFQLQQLLDNLLRNAIEHGGSTTSVTIGRIDGDGFSVADDGPGIPAEVRQRIFQLGYTTSDDGVGYGLKIVQEVADRHGWSVAVTEAAGGGARFEVTGVTVRDPAETG